MNIGSFLPLMFGLPEQSGGASGGGGTQLITMLVTFGLIIVVFLILEPKGMSEIFARLARRISRSARKGGDGGNAAVPRGQ